MQGSLVKMTYKSFRFLLGHAIYNSIFGPLVYKLIHGRKMIYDDAEFLIEGFQRSANTYTSLQFCHLDLRGSVCSHTHSYRAVIKSLERGISTIVLIRNPRDSVASLLAWDENLSISAALWCYHRFYQKLLPYRDHFCTLPFEDAINDFENVLGRVNSQFGCELKATIENQKIEKTRNDSDLRPDSPFPDGIRSERSTTFHSAITQNTFFKQALATYALFLEKR